jgi:hypothetical protein
MNNDLYDNPMTRAAKNAMTPEQLEEYKKIGEHMYNGVDYKIKEMGSEVKEPSKEELAMYATQALNSGLNPFDLSDQEVKALNEVYGHKWYLNFDYKEDEVPKPLVQIVNAPLTKTTKKTVKKNHKKFNRK